VVVPTYARLRTLLRSIQSLEEQTLPDFEILVVDNGSDPSVEGAVRAANQNARIPVCYIPEPRLGLHYARNAGVRAAEGDILVFTDDDATFDPGWLAAYADAFAAHPEMVAAGGPVRPVWQVPPPQWLLDYIGDAKSFGILSLMEPNQDFRLDGYFFGVNMAVRRSVFEWAGFHPDQFETRIIGDGESGLNSDIVRSGGLVGYVPNAIVYHHIPPERMTISYIRKWAWHLGGSQMYEHWWKRQRRLPSLVKEGFAIVRRYRREWLKDPFVRLRRDQESIEIQFQASLGWSKLAYVWWMLTDRQVQAALDIADFRP